MNYYQLYALAGLAGLMLATTARADIIVTYAGQPGAVNSTLQNAQVDTFSGLSSGQYSNQPWTGTGTSAWKTIGTINLVFLQNADQYGGATYPSVYPEASESIGGAEAVPVTTLTLTTASSYFGLWWSAGDPANELSFYKGGVLEAQYTTAQLLGQLSGAYFGNPTVQFKGQDAAEGFAFLNFYGTAGASWDKIVLSNLGSSGFESDDWTSRVEPWGADPGETGSLPGIQVSDVQLVSTPEPGILALSGLGMALVYGAGAFQRSRRPAAAAKA